LRKEHTRFRQYAETVIPDAKRELELQQNGYKYIAGIDEAGRGPLAGPVVAAAVILPLEHPSWLNDVRDSKLLSPKKRSYLYDKIYEEINTVGVGIVSSMEIDSINILQATRLAMQNAIYKVPVLPDYILIDGMTLPDCGISQRCVIKGDKVCLSIACASIVAKVKRDRMMEELDEIYPDYGFARHKGYGTKMHRDALNKLGPTAIHRTSFGPVKKVLVDKLNGIKSSETW